MASYYKKLYNTLSLKDAAAEDASNPDLKVMVNNLMLERLWKKKGASINMFTLKKHI